MGEITLLHRVKSRNLYKGPMDKDDMGGRIECGRRAVNRAGESNGGEMETTVIEQQFKKLKRKDI